MKQFKFSLKRMKDYKDQILDTEKNMLMRLNHERGKVEQRMSDLKTSFEEVNMELHTKTACGISIPEMRSFRFQLENIHIQVQALEAERDRLQARIDRQMQVVLAASQEVAGLGKLEERQLEEYRQLVAKDEEQAIAEFVSQKIVRERMMNGVSS